MKFFNDIFGAMDGWGLYRIFVAVATVSLAVFAYKATTYIRDISVALKNIDSKLSNRSIPNSTEIKVRRKTHE